MSSSGTSLNEALSPAGLASPKLLREGTAGAGGGKSNVNVIDYSWRFYF
jgi:hypothetical protein